MNLIKRIEELPEGKRMLASSRFRRQILVALDQGLEESGMTQSELAQRLGLTRSAVSQVFNGDGNLQAGTISDYLFEMGVHPELVLVPTVRSEAIRTYKNTAVRSIESSTFHRVQSAIQDKKTFDLLARPNEDFSEVGA